MFTQHNPEGFIPAIPGIQRKTLVHGKNTLMSVFHMAGGSQLPLHAHPNEQTGYMISGFIRLKIGDTVFEAHPGDSWCIPENVEHSAEIVEDSFVLEVFAPPRADYLP